jgi:hygromycin-B 4-O-kinase
LLISTAAHAEAFLVEHLGGDIRDLMPVGHGEWSKAYTFAHGGGEFVVRFSAFDADFLKDRLAASYASARLPIPPILDIGPSSDGFYAIAPRASGAFLDALDGTQLRRLLPAFFAGLDAAREVNLSTSTGYGQWGADGSAPYRSWRAMLLDVASDPLESRTHGWHARLNASPTGSGKFEQALEKFRDLVSVCPEQRNLIHADLLNYNVLVDDQRLSAVIDWGCSMYGDFLYDVAWLAYWAPWYPAWDGIDFAAEAARHYAAIGLEIPDLEARLQCYMVHIGLGAQAYNAFKGESRYEALEATARRTLELASASTR